MSFRTIDNADFVVGNNNRVTEFSTGKIALNKNFFIQSIIDTGMLTFVDTQALQAGVGSSAFLNVTAGGTFNLTAADSGKTILYGGQAADANVELPPPDTGLRFYMRAINAGGAFNCNTSCFGGQVFMNGLWLNAAGNGTAIPSRFRITATGAQINKGDYVEFIGQPLCWHVHASSQSATAFTFI